MIYIMFDISRVLLPRKEVIQEQLPLPLPCYDLALVTEPTLERHWRTSGVFNFPRLTGSEYKVRERIQRGMLIHVY